MPYTPPVFNITCNLWICDGARAPADGPPDWTDVKAQKYIAPRAAWPVSPPHLASFWRTYHPPVQLRFAHAGHFSGPWVGWKISVVECPAGTGQYYRVMFADIQHEQFPNEYALLVCVQCDAHGKTAPPAGMGAETGPGPDPCGIQEGGGGGGGGGAHFYDEFTGTAGTDITSHTADTGEAWTGNPYGYMQLDGASSIVDTDSTGVGGNYCVAAYTGPNDGTVLMAFSTLSDPTIAFENLGMIFRALDAANFWTCYLFPDGFGQHYLELSHVVAGVGSVAATAGPFTLTGPSATMTMDAVLSGDTITCHLSDMATLYATLGPITDSSGNDKGVGVWIYQAGGYDTPTIQWLQKA